VAVGASLQAVSTLRQMAKNATIKARYLIVYLKSAFNKN
jgi:hypothetical protein